MNPNSLRALHRREFLAEGSVMEWQPIETAPKDGTTILLFGSWYEGAPLEAKSCFVGKWCTDSVGGEYEYAGDGLYRKKQRTGWAGALNFRATHWMPLPAPPLDGVASTEVSA